MISALQIFKQAGIEDILSPALIGAGVGGLGYGAASYMNNNDPNASTGSKLKSSLSSALKGSALGGVAGAGIGGAHELYNQLTAKPEAIQKLVSSSKDKLDTQPFPVNHARQALLGDLSTSYLTGGAVGGAAGAGLTRAARGAGQLVADKALASQGDHEGGDRIMSAAKDLGMARGAIGSSPVDKLTNPLSAALRNTRFGRDGAIEHLLKSDGTGADPNMGPPAQAEHSREMAKTRAEALMGPEGDRTYRGAGERSQHASKIINRMFSPKMTAVKDYGKGTVAGALAVPTIQKLISMTQKGYLNTAYSPEQLQLWNQMASNK